MIRISTHRKLFAFIAFLISWNIAQADTPAIPAPAPNANPTPTIMQANTPPANMGNSNAVAFAVQAGSIAGAAQACGQDISVFVTRVNEALNRLATNPNDKLAATATFQKALQQAQTTQMNSHPLQCSQVMQDYNSLPILRPDYEQTVLVKLNPDMAATPDANAQNQAPNTQQQTPQQQSNGPIPANSPAAYNPAPPATTPVTPATPAQN